MNELEKYKIDKRNNISENSNGSWNDMIEEGFDAAITLDLPVKFAEWLAENGIKPDGKSKQGDMYWMKYIEASHTNQGTTQQLYQYWITNIYKP